MTVLDFGQKACEKIRRYLDSYLSNELLVETNHEVLRHLENCPACAEELEQKIRARNVLRGAVARVTPSSGLEEHVRKAVRARAASGLAASHVQRWSIAAVVLLGLALGGTQGLRLRRDYEARQTALLDVGLRDHVHCTLGGHYPAIPPTFAEMARKMGPDFVQLVPVVEQKAGDYKVIEGHQCRVGGRKYKHIILRGNHTLMSVIVTRKQQGEAFPRSILLPVLKASGVALHNTDVKNLAVSGFETKDFLVFVVSDLDENANLHVAERMAPGLRGVLAKIES